VENRILEHLPRNGRIAIIRLRSLGDCVLTTPAIDILKRARPDLRIAVVVEDRFRAVFEGSPDIEAILPPGIPETQRWRPELCLNLHGGTRSAWMTALSGARQRAGFAHFRGQFAYDVRIPRAQEILGVDRKVHTAEHLASAMFYLGAPTTEIPRAKLFSVGQASGLPAVIHPFASSPAKTWPAANFLALAEHLNDCIFIGGPTDDLTPFHSFRTLAGAPLSEIKSLLAGASLFIGNDSGPAHMAAAFGVPSIVMFGDSDREIWGPWRTPSEILDISAGVDQAIEAVARLRVHA
jgi:ADP-heptose:LPS heptosyltransferase